VLWVVYRQPKILASTEIAYPCLRIHDSNAWEIIEDASQLQRMHSNFYMMRSEEPWVIDAQMRVMEMHKLSMKGSPFWLMFTGPRTLDVTFELKLSKGDTEAAAKKLVGRVLQSVDAELNPQLAEELSQVKTWQEMTDILIREDRTGKYNKRPDPE
jgi:hypothetical protein